jgi:hypothetical protein
MTAIEHPVPRADPELLALARAVLESEDYALETLDRPMTMLLAENRYFLIAVVTTATIAQLLVAESLAEGVVAERLIDANPGPKRWDAYIVLLTQERSPETRKSTRELFDINYDTVRVRRIAHVGVDNRLDSVRTALAPFVAPIRLDDPILVADAFDALRDALAEKGVDREVAARAITAFRQGAKISDAI